MNSGADVNNGLGYKGAASALNLKHLPTAPGRPVRVGVNRKASNSPLICAIQEDDSVEMMRLLLDRGAEVDAGDRYIRTALTYAITQNKMNTVKTLLEQGAAALIDECRSEQPVASAIQSGNVDVLEMLAEKAGTLAFHDPEGNAESNLLQLVPPGDADKISVALIRHHVFDALPSSEQYRSTVVPDRETLRIKLLEAAYRGDMESLIQQIDEAKRLNDTLLLNSGLHAAIAGNCLDAVIKLLDAGADANAKLPNERNALQMSIYGQSLEVTRTLLDRGASLLEKDITGGTALEQLARTQRPCLDIMHLIFGRAAALEKHRLETRRDVLEKIIGRWIGSGTTETCQRDYFLPDVILDLKVVPDPSGLNPDLLFIRGSVTQSRPDLSLECEVMGMLYEDATLFCATFKHDLECSNYYGKFDMEQLTIQGTWAISKDMLEGDFSLKKQEGRTDEVNMPSEPVVEGLSNGDGKVSSVTDKELVTGDEQARDSETKVS